MFYTCVGTLNGLGSALLVREIQVGGLVDVLSSVGVGLGCGGT